ncbi:thyrotropin-releasing hormone receptor-like [Acanthaster planci]|uniref:Thyrotropin-releasing hormone receptor-like n=1 Tax=Acanthaster planci TaxID=133434 RepID=A0A8B7ZA77_ACAPL|nr:thyrotropin-releasing hormone receptor-like [Acanthaster planci]
MLNASFADFETHQGVRNQAYIAFSHSLVFVNETDLSKARSYIYDPTSTAIYGYVLPIIKLFGLLGILTFYFMVYRVREMRNLTNFYLGSLAVADLMVLLTSGSLLQYEALVTRTFSNKNYLGPSAGLVFDIKTLFTQIAIFASLFCVVVVTYERYLAICHPLKHKHVQGMKRAFRSVVFAWSASLVVPVFDFAIFRTLTEARCVVFPNDEEFDNLSGLFQLTALDINYARAKVVFENISYLVVYLVTFVANATLNGLIIHKLWNPNSPGRSSKLSGLHQVTLMLVLNSTVCFATLLPLTVSSLTNTFKPEAEFGDKVIAIPPLFVVLNSAINTVLFNVGSRRYRNAFLEAFRCRSRERKPQSNDIAL